MNSIEVDAGLRALYQDKFAYVSMFKTRFVVPHLVELYHRFDGDIVLVIVFGEIAIRNFQRVMEMRRDQPYQLFDASRMDVIRAEGAPQPWMSPATVSSIARSTRVPRETVRRKVEALIARGWIERDKSRHLRLSSNIGDDLREFDVQETLAFARAAIGIVDLLAAAKRDAEAAEPQA